MLLVLKLRVKKYSHCDQKLTGLGVKSTLFQSIFSTSEPTLSFLCDPNIKSSNVLPKPQTKRYCGPPQYHY